MSDEELTRWLIGIGGMSEAIARYPEWVRSALALTRDDLRLCQTHQPRGGPPLPCPIEVFAGADDPLLSPAEAAQWSRHTSAGCRVHAMPGGHFFVLQSPAVFLSALAAALHPL